MSQENVELMRTAIGLMNSGDWDGTLAMWHPDLEFRDRGHPPDMPEVLRGRHAVRRMTAEWEEIYGDLRVEVLHYFDADPWVICDARWYGRSTGSGMQLDAHNADAYQILEGKIVRAILSFPDVATALKAVGLEE